MKRFSPVLASLLALAGCGQSGPGANFDGTIEDRVKFVAGNMDSFLTGLSRDHVTFKEANADGRTLVLRFDTDLEGSTSGSSEELSKLFRPKVCGNSGYRTLIEQGAAIRFEFSRSKYGDSLEPFSIAYCSE